MKAAFSLLALAATVLAQGLELAPRWPSGTTTTMTTYTTTTYCPVTTTKIEVSPHLCVEEKEHDLTSLSERHN